MSRVVILHAAGDLERLAALARAVEAAGHEVRAVDVTSADAGRILEEADASIACATPVATLRSHMERLEKRTLSIDLDATSASDQAAVVASLLELLERTVQVEFEYDIALSYASENRDYVDEVARLLQTKRVRVFYDAFEEARLWGKDLYRHLSDVYQKKARYCVIFASSHYANKAWTNLELRSAQARALMEKEEYILPARFDETDVPGVSPTLKYLDLRELTPPQLVERILEKLGTSAGRTIETLPVGTGVIEKGPGPTDRKPLREHRIGLPAAFAVLLAIPLLLWARSQPNPATPNGSGDVRPEGPIDLEAAYRHYDGACKAGEMEGCFNLASLYRQRKAAEDLGRALELLEQGCVSGHGRSCQVAGVMLEHGESGPADAVLATRRYESGCGYENGEACFNLGNMYQNGRGVSVDLEAAVRAFKRACEHDSGKGCSNLGQLTYDGRGVPRDRAEAARIWERACNLAIDITCHNAAAMLLGVEGVVPDYRKALDLLDRACRANLFDSCSAAADLLREGKVVTRDWPQAALYYDRACASGVHAACVGRAGMYACEMGGSNRAKATTMLDATCKAGYQPACVSLGAVLENAPNLCSQFMGAP